MPLSEQELLEVLELFQRSGWQDMQLRSGTRSLVVSKSGRRAAPASGAGQPGQADGAARAQPAASGPSPPSPLPRTGEGRVAAPGETIDPSWVVVKAPMLGTYFAAPKPGAEPFVRVGQTVAADDTVGILEVMKLMNDLKAGVAGRIARIVIGNGDLVEFDQAILYIEATP